jgi:hypothetical protein
MLHQAEKQREAGKIAWWLECRCNCAEQAPETIKSASFSLKIEPFQAHFAADRYQIPLVQTIVQKSIMGLAPRNGEIKKSAE